MSTSGTSSAWIAESDWRVSLSPPPCRPHGFTHVLILGGPRGWRMRVATRCHREGVLRKGPFVSLGPSDDATLRHALESRLMGSPPHGHGDPLARAEGGTLFLDGIDGLGMATQRLVLRFLDRLLPGVHERPGAWAGCVIAGCAPPGRGPAADRLLMPLFDALDKIRIEFPATPPEVTRAIRRGE